MNVVVSVGKHLYLSLRICFPKLCICIKNIENQSFRWIVRTKMMRMKIFVQKDKPNNKPSNNNFKFCYNDNIFRQSSSISHRQSKMLHNTI